MNDTPALVDLDYITNNIIFSLRLDNNLYGWVLQKIINQIRDINIFHLGTKGIKSGKFAVSDVNTVALPEDYINYVFIGTISNGEKVSYGDNNNIAKTLTESCAEDQNKNYSETTDYPIGQHYSITGGVNIIDFTIDKKNRRIILRGNITNKEIYMEYISTGISFSEKTLVPIQYYSMLEAYIDYHNEMTNQKQKNNLLFMKNQKYIDEIKRLREFENRMTLEEFYDAIRQGYQQTIKR